MSEKQIIYKHQYISRSEVDDIRKFIELIGDSLDESIGPRATKKSKLGTEGCWDRQLHLEFKKSPVNKLIQQLRQDFGDFEIYESSVRYLAFPFLPHSDVRSAEWVKEYKLKGYKPGFVFLIPLWWENNYQPGTAFFNSPIEITEELYCDHLDSLPNYSDHYKNEMKNYSIRKIVNWQSPGDLIAWENFQFHCSCQFSNTEYSLDRWVKEFISIETWVPPTK